METEQGQWDTQRTDRGETEIDSQEMKPETSLCRSQVERLLFIRVFWREQLKTSNENQWEAMRQGVCNQSDI